MISFERAGRPAPVTGVRSTSPDRHEIGVVLNGETSAWPRGLAINLRPDDAATRVAVERVQRRLDWFSPRRFELEMARDWDRLRPDRDRIRLEGVDAEALPPGRYRLQVRLSGMRLKPSVVRIRIPRDGAAEVVLKEKPASRVVRLKRTVAEFDTVARTILEHERSRLDGLPAAEWLTGPAHLDRRKACLLNLLAKLAASPIVQAPFHDQVESVFFAEADRIYVAAQPALLAEVEASDRFQDEPNISDTHKKLLSRLSGRDPENYDLKSFREGAKPSMQMTFAVPKPDLTDRTHFVDMDIDLGNPRWDLTSFAIHIGELVNPAKTNHLKLRTKIQRATGGDFTYYDVVKS